jgi:hypothetical protein
MLPRSAREYIFTGVIHLELQAMQPGQPLRAEGGVGPLDRIEYYLDSLIALGLSTTSTAAWQLQVMRDHLQTFPPESPLTPVDAQKIQNVSLMLRETLYADAANLTL